MKIKKLFFLLLLLVCVLPLSSFKVHADRCQKSLSVQADVEFGDFEYNGAVYAVYGTGSTVTHVYDMFNGGYEVAFSDAIYMSNKKLLTITIYPVPGQSFSVSNQKLEFY